MSNSTGTGDDRPSSGDSPDSDGDARGGDDPATQAPEDEERASDAEAGEETADGEAEANGDEEESVTVEDGPAGREVIVPMALYKRVTVVSTLVAMVSIVAGFGLLDRATDRASVPLSQVDPLLAILGLGLIAAGGGVYAFSTRFRAAGMGSPKSDEGRSEDNG